MNCVAPYLIGYQPFTKTHFENPTGPSSITIYPNVFTFSFSSYISRYFKLTNFDILQTKYDITWIIYTNQINNNNMTYEHEITFNNDDLYYLTSTTNYLNDNDKQFLIDELIDLNNIKSINTYKL